MDVEHVEEVNKAPVGHEGQPMLLQMSTEANLRIKVSTSVTSLQDFTLVALTSNLHPKSFRIRKSILLNLLHVHHVTRLML